MSPKLFILVLLLAQTAQAAMPGYQWFPANEFYFTAPSWQKVNFPDAGGGERSAEAWGFGYRVTGDGEGVNRTGGLQFQTLTVASRALGVKGAFTLLEMPVGAEYISGLYKDTRLRFTASALADLGLCSNTLYMSPMLTAGLLQDKPDQKIPGGWSLTAYYRFTDIELEDVHGYTALRAVLGFRLGYTFPSFWGPK